MNIGNLNDIRHWMKTQRKSSLWALALLALLSAPSLASAYYDPGVQRWINRDPIGDIGSPVALGTRYGDLPPLDRLSASWADQNPYGFDRNSPIGFVDTDGRIAIAIPIAVGGGVAITIGQGFTVGLAICYVIPSCRAALQNLLSQAVDRIIGRCKPRPPEADCRLVAATGTLCLYSCSSPGGGYMGAIDKPPGGCPKTATHDDVKPMPGRDYPGFPTK